MHCRLMNYLSPPSSHFIWIISISIYFMGNPYTGDAKKWKENERTKQKKENEAKKREWTKKRIALPFLHRTGKSRLKTRWCFLKQPNNEKIIENKYRSVELNIYYIIVHRLHGFKILKFGFYLPPACLAASSSVLTFISRSLCLKIKTLFT